MKGDFTRMTFNPQKHFSRVLMQQGRVQLDADWNEQAEITTHRVETESVDAIGACGAPIHAPAFSVIPSPTTLPAEEQQRLTDLGWLPLTAGDFILSAGRFYVDGILVENEHPVPYTRQSDLPGLAPLTAGSYLAYLDVWSRHLTALEVPEIREVALGGPDTATRAHTVWQVRVMPVEGDSHCLTSLTDWDALLAGTTGKLSARTHPDAASKDPCIVPPTAGFRGLQNQLYRVEIHAGGGLNGATFKWSRDNGSLVFAIEEFVAGHLEQVRVRSLGHDQELGLRKGDWVEVLDDDSELSCTPGTMAQINDIDEDDAERSVPTLTLSANISGYGLSRHAKVRRWDGEVQTVRRPAGNEHFIPLENGVEVKFETGTYHTGDYWLIPARSIPPALTQTGGIEWPVDGAGEAVPLSPEGIQHHYCRLAVINFNGTTFTVEDCRPFFPPVTELIELFYLGGDGQVAFPGKQLPMPLEAGVSLGQWPVEGARVRFRILRGSGTLTGGGVSGNDIVVETQATGVASVAWQLDQATPHQQVQASLQDVAAADLHLPIHYNASLGFELYPVGGDGQEALSGEALPKPLEVRLTDGHWPVTESIIIFKLEEPGDGLLTASDGRTSNHSLDVLTDGNGLAFVSWTLGEQNSQRVAAFWKEMPDQEVHFNANLDTGQGQPQEPAIHIVDVVLNTGKPLVHDEPLPVGEFVEGFRIVCDQEVNQRAVRNKPVCIVTLDLPYPFNQADMTLWDIGDVFAFQPLILDAQVNSDNESIFWTPAQPTRIWLQERLFQVMKARKRGDSVLVHVHLKGNFIWGAKDKLTYIDGDAFGARSGETPNNLRLPSGDRIRGGDFEMWFRLVQG